MPVPGSVTFRVLCEQAEVTAGSSGAKITVYSFRFVDIDGGLTFAIAGLNPLRCNEGQIISITLENLGEEPFFVVGQQLTEGDVDA